MKFKIILISIFAILIIYISANTLSIINYAKIDEQQTADVAIVLGAGTHNNEITPVFKERVNHGIWLYKNGYAGKLILTGGYGKNNAYSDAFIAKQYAVSENIPEEDIIIEEQSTITQENIKNAKNIMDANNYTTAIIVSDPLHMKRAMLMANDYGIKAYSSPTPTTRYISLKSKLPFLARELFFFIGYKAVNIFY